LDNSNTYPNANAAILGVIVLLVASLALWGVAGPRDRRRVHAWATSVAVVGLCLSGMGRLFI
jgi:hypothetical protein